jgi:hypothetical protein
MDQQAGPGDAALSARGKDTRDRTVRRAFEIGVVEHDVGRFAPQFHAERGEIVGRGADHMAGRDRSPVKATRRTSG